MNRAHEPWVQTIGRIAIHEPGRAPRALNGSTRMLLCLLVAAGRDGTTVENIANAYWRDERPTSWRIGLRLATSHLSSLLPVEWEIVTTDERVQLTPAAGGWVDTWRIEDEYTRDSFPNADPRPAWIGTGPTFGGIDDIEMIDQAANRLDAILDSTTTARSDRAPREGSLPLEAGEYQQLADRVRATRRHVFVGAADKLAMIRQVATEDANTETAMIVGDRRLLLPLGPFAMAFPRLRDELQLAQGIVEPGVAAKAWRTLADTMALGAQRIPQRILIANAHELDRTSLLLASFLIERGPLRDFSIVLLADHDHRDIRWLDFVSRAVTAGCTLDHVG